MTSMTSPQTSNPLSSSRGLPGFVQKLAFRATATLALLVALAASAPGYDIETVAMTFEPDNSEQSALRHHADLVSSADWCGPELRLISFLDGNLWLLDGLGGVEFSGFGIGIAPLQSGTVVDGSGSFVPAGFGSGFLWGDDAGGLPFASESQNPSAIVGFHRSVGETEFFGAFLLTLQDDRSVLLQSLGMAENSFNTSDLLAVPEPAAASVLVGIAAVTAGTLRSRRKRLV